MGWTRAERAALDPIVSYLVCVQVTHRYEVEVPVGWTRAGRAALDKCVLLSGVNLRR